MDNSTGSRASCFTKPEQTYNIYIIVDKYEEVKYTIQLKTIQLQLPYSYGVYDSFSLSAATPAVSNRLGSK